MLVVRSMKKLMIKTWKHMVKRTKNTLPYNKSTTKILIWNLPNNIMTTVRKMTRKMTCNLQTIINNNKNSKKMMIIIGLVDSKMKRLQWLNRKNMKMNNTKRMKTIIEFLIMIL